MCGGGLLKPGRSVTIAALIGFLNIGPGIQALAQTDSAAKRHFDLQLKDGRIANAFKRFFPTAMKSMTTNQNISLTISEFREKVVDNFNSIKFCHLLGFLVV